MPGRVALCALGRNTSNIQYWYILSIYLYSFIALPRTWRGKMCFYFKGQGDRLAFFTTAQNFRTCLKKKSSQ